MQVSPITARRILALAAVTFVLSFLMIVTVTLVWMMVPTSIIYRESSLVPTDTQVVRVVEHGTSFFITPGQKRLLDIIRTDTAPVWLGCLGLAVVAYLTGAAAQLRIPGPPKYLGFRS
jgi:hypothetical protein